MAATVTIERIAGQNEPEHQRRLHENLSRELGPTTCELLDESTEPLKIRAGLKKKGEHSPRFRFYFEREVAGTLSLSVSRRPFGKSAGFPIGIDSNDRSSGKGRVL